MPGNSTNTNNTVAIGKNSFHLIGLDGDGAIVLQIKFPAVSSAGDSQRSRRPPRWTCWHCIGCVHGRRNGLINQICGFLIKRGIPCIGPTICSAPNRRPFDIGSKP